MVAKQVDRWLKERWVSTVSTEMIGSKERCVSAYRDRWLKRATGEYSRYRDDWLKREMCGCVQR
jgi:hypothetical protein